MSKLSEKFNEYFYAWGNNDPNKEVLRYGKMVSLKDWHGYDDFKYYRPRRNAAGGLIILGGVTLIGGVCTGIHSINNKRKSKKESL
ncbi:hypothetical protein ACFQWC_14310 [Rossellomorea sp. GCM10028870]|uniref:hypothetical protein n=1 Tax=Rossellomorea sp. GCM10028870 TaxID=3273426 RepID=UPI00361E6AD2